MLFKWFKKKDRTKGIQYPERDVSISEVREAVWKYAEDLRKGIGIRVVIKDDNAIDYDKIKHYLKCIPTKQYYMSKENYDIFDENGQKLAQLTDIVQRAVDKYVEMEGKLPMVKDDPYKRVNYLMLKDYLKPEERPNINFYFTGTEYIITHRKPKG